MRAQEEHTEMPETTARIRLATTPGSHPLHREWGARLPFDVVLGPYRVAFELRPRLAAVATSGATPMVAA